MKISISNIGWDKNKDLLVYRLMKKYGFLGLEIAPTRIFPNNPYDHLAEAKLWGKSLNDDYGFLIPSMQSIWYGRREKIFGSAEERAALVGYTKKAVDFASVIGCKNLVFGCPQNRHLPDGADKSLAISFFRKIGDYAFSKDTCIGMEANPPIYNTNFINDTKAALELIEQVDSKGFKLNLDVGTIIHNKEDVSEIINKVHLINHVHISEPELKIIKERKLHYELKEVLVKENYQGFVSVEMGRVDDISLLEKTMMYVREVYR